MRKRQFGEDAVDCDPKGAYPAATWSHRGKQCGMLAVRASNISLSHIYCLRLLQKYPVITDENVLTPLTMTLTMLGREGDALCCWEQAFAANPKDESVGRELFNCLVRLRDFAKRDLPCFELFVM